AARERLAALGFRDPVVALRHLEALTVGVSRRAAIQRTLLPVMLGWFADEADPDAGLLAFRRVSDELGSIHWYLKMLRDEGSSAERLAHVLGRSRYVADLLVRSPESVAFLGDATGLAPSSRADLTATMTSAAGRRHDPDLAIAAVQSVRRHELLRIAFGDLVGGLSLREVGRALTDLTAATFEAALQIATRVVAAQHDGVLGTRMLVVGMGSLGGSEMGYGSDADVLFVHEPEEGVEENEAQARALQAVQELIRLLGAAGSAPPLGVSAELRPEGRNGPLVRSLESYRAYYERWALTWEFQALLRAAPVAGDLGLAGRFVALIEPVRWPEGGISARQVRDIRTLKARVEAERLPRGADPRTHFKLGRGGLTDVEWTVQLLALRHGYAHPALRTTSTMEALDAAESEGLITPGHARDLREGWTLAQSLRNAAVLWRGRSLDSLPTDLRDADGVGRIIGRPPGRGADLAETYLRVARRCRLAMDLNFYLPDTAGTVG
ncbi:MAG TPA: bifunctional [glutamine synthetase] adenylyltransferase/[glutamine synthetase]-adenylyl-L-tyrosine phosphorylase, partial [Candidatus Lustribacter sp.]|nr:bifunctional [glutamine synthetase] adenylyltransferase/[glutamine synthetase]-adenylyl-L-tyrosine phosphorylase [Candidatus Lustribacter sp.]